VVSFGCHCHLSIGSDAVRLPSPLVSNRMKHESLSAQAHLSLGSAPLLHEPLDRLLNIKIVVHQRFLQAQL
jgi:hypothetical protein